MQNQTGGAPPVFVDRTGRRRRLTVIAGTAMGLGLLTSLGLILAGLFFDSSVPIPGWSDTKMHPPIEAGVDGPARPQPATSPTTLPEPITGTASSRPSSAPPASRATATRTLTAPAAQPTGSVPGQGDEHRSTAKPSKTSGKP
jgi:hypothetical protein